MTEQHPNEQPASYAVRRRLEAGELTREAAIAELIAHFGGGVTRVGAEVLLDHPGGLGKTEAVASSPHHPRVKMREIR